MPIERSRATSKSKLMEKAVLLLVDDDQLITESLSFILKKKYQVYSAASREQAKALISTLKSPPQLAVVDLGLPPYPHKADEGFALIEDLLTLQPQMKILVSSGLNNERSIQHVLTLGAVEYLAKPVDPALLKVRLQHHHMLQLAEQQNDKNLIDSALIGGSDAMKSLRQQVKQFKDSPQAVFIEGEPGTGKELIARALHRGSSLNKNACVSVNCAGIDSKLLEAQLFGCLKGAMQGVNTDLVGYFLEARNGSLFLADVDELSDDLQSKLLRLMESGEYSRIGESRILKFNARVISSSNEGLTKKIKNGSFRMDLFHHLSVLNIKVPALRQRGDDSLQLRIHFQNLYEDSIKHFSLDNNAQKLWLEYDYPGNVIELKNLVIRLGTKYPNKILTASELEIELGIDKDDEVQSLKSGFQAGSFNDVWLMKEISSGRFNLHKAVEELEKHCIGIAMEMYDGNLSQVAKVLNLSRNQLFGRVLSKTEKGYE